MKPELHQHPTDDIFVRSDSGIYKDTPEDFTADCLTVGITESLPTLPEGAIERIYVQGVRHAVMSSETIIEGGPMPWPLGDTIIAALPELLAAQADRQPPVQTLDPELQRKAIEDAANARAKVGAALGPLGITLADLASALGL
jgi:hypothetical protein